MARKKSTTNLRISVVPGGAASNSTGKATKAKKKNKQANGAARIAYRGGLDAGGYSSMLNDPCQAKLLPGFYGSSEGYLARFHKVLSPPILVNSAGTAPVGTCGAFLWIPDFSCQGKSTATSSTYNLIQVVYTNTASNFDLTGYTTVGGFYNSLASEDPSYYFVNGTTCGDARTLSACVRMSYLGPVSTAQGMVGTLNIPFSALEDRIAGGTLNIDGLFELSEMVSRTSLDPIEQKWTPGELSSVFRGSASGAAPAAGADFCVNVNSGVFSVGTNASTSNPRVIGFVYKGFASGTAIDSLLQFDCYKNIEWKPQSGSGLSCPTPVRTAVVPPYQMALASLDSVRPGWKSQVAKSMESAASRTAKKALAYSGQMLMRKAPQLAGFLM